MKNNVSYLVDTNIISELSRLHPNAGVLDWSQSITLVSPTNRGAEAERGTPKAARAMELRIFKSMREK